ncbi:PAS domain S-box protein [Candidatus Woesearchaeota archaeon]|nr:PAS domain S-box protein [Candidatus Woesearchaeota archaeon]
MKNILELILSFGEFSCSYMVLVSQDLKIKWINKALEKQGYRLSSVRDKSCHEVFKETAYCNEFAITEAFNMHRMVKEERNGYKTISFPIKRDNKVDYVLFMSSRLKEEGPVPPNLKSRLDESEKRFYDLALCSGDFVWEVDRNGKYIYASAGVKKIMGYSPKEIVGKSPFYFMPKDEARKIRLIFGKISSLKKPIVDLENSNLRKDGKEIILLTNGVPILDESGSLEGYRGVDKDITEKKKSEQEIKESEEKLKALFNYSRDMYYVLDKERNMTFCSPQSKALLGYTPEYMKKNWSRLGFSGNQARPDKRNTPYLLELLAKNRKKVLLEINEIVLKDGNGKIKDILGIARNITPDKESEDFTIIQRDIGFAFSVSKTLKEAMALFLEKLMSIDEIDCGGIYLVDNEVKELELIHHVGLPASFIKETTSYKFKSSQYRIVMKSQPIFTRYDRLSVRKDNQKKKEGIKAIAVLPITFQDNVIACLNVASHTQEMFSEQTRLVITNLVSQLGEIIVRFNTLDQLEKAKDFSEKIIETAPLFIVGLDVKGDIVLFNNVAEKISGYKKDEVIGKNWFLKFIKEGDKVPVEKVFRSLLESESENTYTNPIIVRDGKELMMNWSNSIIKDDQGNIESVIALGEDITLKLKYEQEREKLTEELKQRVSELERFHNLTVGRELRMIELKKKIKELQARLEVQK